MAAFSQSTYISKSLFSSPTVKASRENETLSQPEQRNIRELVERVQARQPSAFEELYGLVKNFTFFLMRQLGAEDLQDKVHDVFLTVTQSILSGKLRDPERLIPFLTTVTRFYTYSQIERRVSRRHVCGLSDSVNPPDTRVNLEHSTYQQQRMKIAHEVLSAMPRRDRDVLSRFYLKEQSKEQICDEMQLTPTQFRLLKSKAKSTFTELGERRLKRCRT
ncbi:MAG: sigma-70 family RNA polymerase sigma factor [Acidobacteriota bacterium]|nr:sigma-70 family RNA polymerase sigma factor [Acidobacteriota bacterium]